MTFRVYYSNFFYYAEPLFSDFASALTYAKRAHFQARIEGDGKLIASWCPIAGTRIYDPKFSTVRV